MVTIQFCLLNKVRGETMNLLTHMVLSRIIHKQYRGLIKLDRSSFLLGNLKPDLTKECLKNPHIPENYLQSVSSKMDQQIHQCTSVENCSLELGIASHYFCDFFCKYHLNGDHFRKLLRHMCYELILMLALLRMLLLDRIQFFPIEATSSDIAKTIINLRNEYSKDKHSMDKDICFAISSSIWICEYVMERICIMSDEYECNIACSETFGNVVLEALASGTAVI